jgi:uncharacterized membrane protein
MLISPLLVGLIAAIAVVVLYLCLYSAHSLNRPKAGGDVAFFTIFVVLAAFVAEALLITTYLAR